MYHYEKNSKIFSPEGPRENVWGPCENISPGPAMALDRSVIWTLTSNLGVWAEILHPNGRRIMFASPTGNSVKFSSMAINRALASKLHKLKN